MNEYTPNDDSRLGFIQSQVPGVTVYNKRGTLTDEFLVVADVALVIHNENVYSVILLSRQASQNHTTYELLEVAAGEIAGAFSRYLMACSSQPETCP